MNKIYYPLSNPQKLLNFLQMKNPYAPMLNLSCTLKLCDEVNPEYIEKSIHILIQTNDGLRIKMVNLDGELMQYISEYSEKKIDLFEFNTLEELNIWVESEAEKPFILIEKELYYFAILKLSDNEYRIYIKIHHLIADGWSVASIAYQINNCYSRLKRNEYVEMDKLPSYVQFIEDEIRYMETDEYINGKNLWYKKYEDYKGSSMILKKEGFNSAKMLKNSLAFPEGLSIKVNELCGTLKTYPIILFTAIMQIYTYFITGEKDCVVTFLLHNRLDNNQKNTVGNFVIGIPLRTAMNDNMDFKTLIKKVLSELKYGIKNGRSYVYEDFNTFSKGMAVLKTISIANDKFEQSEDDIGDRIEYYSSGYGPVPLIFRIIEDQNRNISLIYEYQIDVFSEHQINDMHNGILRILNAIIDKHEIKLNEVFDFQHDYA